MDLIREFQPAHVIDDQNIVIVIGTIRGQHAVYTIPPPTVSKRDIEEALLSSASTLRISTKVLPRLIYPASDQHIAKYTSGGVYEVETYKDYLRNDDCLKTSWLDNIVNASRGSHSSSDARPENAAKDTTGPAPLNEEILFENEHYLFINDHKWDRKSSDYLYLLVIFKNDKYRSIREVDDVALLEAAKRDILSVCGRYGVSQEDLCLYFHYRPSYFRLHIHVVNISRSLKYLGSVVRDILLDEVIQNLKTDPDYYRKDCFIINLNKK